MTTYRRLSVISCAFGVMLSFPMVVTNSLQAADFFWVGGTGLWNDDVNNWSSTEGGTPGAGIPGPTDNARLIQSSDTNVVVTYQAGNPAVSFLPIDATGTGTITFSLAQGDLVAEDEQSGRDGQGIFNHSGGTNTIGNVLLLGRNAGSNGQYNFSGGVITALGQIVGHEGTGVFNHTGGTNTATSSFQIGAAASGQGTYNLSGMQSSLTTPESFVGAFGHGAFVQSEGTHTVDGTIGSGGTGSLTLGFGGGSRGTYALSGGTLEVKGNEFIGVVGQGIFTQTGGSHTVGNMAAITGDLNLGVADQFGQDVDRLGIFNLNGGSLEVGDDEFIGLDGIGIFNQTQGTNTMGDRLVIGKLTAAATAGTPTDVIGTGVYNLTGGDLSSAKGEVGEFGIGTLNQTGGTYTVTSQLQIGKETTGIGTYNLLNGDLFSNSMVVGNLGIGTFNQAGGTNTTDSVNIAAFASSTGTYNLKAGSLTATGAISNSGTFNFSGGNLTANLIVNDGTFVVSGGGFRVINGDITNNAIVKTITGTTPVFGGTFTNNGLVVNDPIFLGDVVNATDGVFVENEGGEAFIFGRDFINKSRKNVEWKTDESVLAFVNAVDLGASGVFNTQFDHDLFLPGVDLGSNEAGFIDNFAWEALSLASGNSLTLFDGNTNVFGGALYVKRLLLADELAQIDNIIGNDLNIYYLPGLADNAYLGGQTFNLQGGGQIIPIPEPTTFILMASGLLLYMTGRRTGRKIQMDVSNQLFWDL